MWTGDTSFHIQTSAGTSLHTWYTTIYDYFLSLLFFPDHPIQCSRRKMRLLWCALITKNNSYVKSFKCQRNVERIIASAQKLETVNVSITFANIGLVRKFLIFSWLVFLIPIYFLFYIFKKFILFSAYFSVPTKRKLRTSLKKSGDAGITIVSCPFFSL